MIEYWSSKSKIPAVLWDLIIPYFDQNLKVLDLGCAAGRLVGGISNHFSQAGGIDLSQELIDAARLRFPQVSFCCGDYHSWDMEFDPDLLVSDCAIRKDYTDLEKLVKGRKFVFRIQGDQDLSEILSKEKRQSLFFSLQELSILKFRKVQEEKYKQKFSSVGYLQQYLSNINIPLSVNQKYLKLSRHYVVVAN